MATVAVLPAAGTRAVKVVTVTAHNMEHGAAIRPRLAADDLTRYLSSIFNINTNKCRRPWASCNCENLKLSGFLTVIASP